MPEVTVNYVLILIAAVAMMILGALWYGSLFGKEWAKMMGFDMSNPDVVKQMKEKAKPGYAITFAASLVMLYVLTHILSYAGAETPRDGVEGALWVWLGFIAPTLLGSVLWEGKPWKLYFINASYYLVSLIVAAAIITQWS